MDQFFTSKILSIKEFKMKNEKIIKIDLNFMSLVFKEALNLKNKEINLNSRFEQVSNWDSLGHMKIISEIESRLNLEFEIDEIVGVDTVKKLINMVNKKLKK